MTPSDTRSPSCLSLVSVLVTLGETSLSDIRKSLVTLPSDGGGGGEKGGGGGGEREREKKGKERE